MSGQPNIIDKEGLLMEILQSKNEIELMEYELYKLKKKRKKLEQKFLANKLIIEGILDIQDDNNENNNTDNFKFITENTHEKIETDYIGKEENNIKSNNEINYKTETNYFYDNNNRSNINNNFIINCLKKQIINCDKNIEDKNKIMEIKKNDGRVDKFLHLNYTIDAKNRELEELVSKSQTLQYVILDVETRIEYFVVKTKNYIDNINKLNETLNNNNSKILKNEKIIQS